MKKYLVFVLSVLLCNRAGADTVFGSATSTSNVYQQSSTPNPPGLGGWTGANVATTTTGSITATASAPSDGNPAHMNITLTFSASFAGPAAGQGYIAMTADGYNVSFTPGTPGWQNSGAPTYYNFSPTESQSYTLTNVSTSWTITQSGYGYGINGVTPSIVLTGGTDITLDYRNVGGLPGGIPSQYINPATGNATMEIMNGLTVLATFQVTQAMAISGNYGLQGVSFPPGYTSANQVINLAALTYGAVNTVGGGIQETGNNTNTALTYISVAQLNGEISQGGAVGGGNLTIANPTVGLGTATAAQNPYNSPTVGAPLISAAGVTAPAGATPLWVNPLSSNSSYVAASGDALTNTTYRQGVANEMNLASEIDTNLQTTSLIVGNTTNGLLTSINATLASGGGSGGGSGGNVSDAGTHTLLTSLQTTDSNILANSGNIENSLTGLTATDSSLLTVANSENSTLLGYAPSIQALGNVSAAMSAAQGGNRTSSQMGSDASSNVGTFTSALPQPITVPDYTPSESSAASLLMITLPPSFGGQTFDLNPFESGRCAGVASAFRTAVAWLAVVMFGIWLSEQMKQSTSDGLLAHQTTGNAVMGGTGAQATAYAAAGLITVGLLIMCGALVTLWDTNWPIFGSIANTISALPMASFPAACIWMCDQVFPIATLCTCAVMKIFAAQTLTIITSAAQIYQRWINP